MYFLMTEEEVSQCQKTLTSIDLFSWLVCWWSTRHTPALGSSTNNSSIVLGFSTFHSFSAKDVSELTSDALAGIPP